MPPVGNMRQVVTDLASKNKVMVFSKSTCPFCIRVSTLLVFVVVVGYSAELALLNGLFLFKLNKGLLKGKDKRSC